MSIVLDTWLFATGWIHVLLAPYTKVEESFNLHAIHDVLVYGVGSDALQNYDHFVFPGSVPRTFLGSVLLASLANPILHLASKQDLVGSKFDLQIIARLVLASVNALGFCLLRRAVGRRFGQPTSLLFVLLSCSQFHIPFWMGRTLPNMFALFPVNISSYLILNCAPNATRPSNQSIHVSIALLTFTTVVFRSEVLLFLGPLVSLFLLLQYITFSSVFKVGVIAGFLSLGLTVLVDSYFWSKYPIWPEFQSLYFNIYQGKSSEWGVSPFHAYLTALLPKLLLSSLPLSILGAFLDPRIRTLLLPSLVFIALISCLGHKEWRFVIYVVPLFNVAAARGARWMLSRRKSSIIGRLLFVAFFAFLAANCFATYVLTSASIANYPGGEALSRFNTLYQDHARVHVHISNFAAQTGASLFLHEHSLQPNHLVPPHSGAVSVAHNWTYDKTESLSPASLTATQDITHLIAESKDFGKEWEVVESIEGFAKWKVDLDAVNGGGAGGLGKVLDILKMEREEKLWIMERKARRT